MEPHFRHNVALAVTWRIVAELLRRHGARHDLRVIETHPCSGQYDCVTLCAPPGAGAFAAAADFHVPAQHFHVHQPFTAVEPRPVRLGGDADNAYVLAYLTAADPKEVVDAVEASLGLPAPVGPLGETPASLAARSLAMLLDRRMNDRRRLDVRNGWSEDGWSAALAPWVSEVPGFAPLAASGSVSDQIHQGRRLWRVAPVESSRGVTFDFSRAAAHSAGRTIDLAAARREAGGRLERAVDRLDEWLRG